jgi:apolipoprotein N-acyltransferase
MFLMISVAALCGVLLIALLLRVACRYRKDLWFTSDDVILCFVAPSVILLGAFAGLSIGYRLEHGGLGEVSVAGWIGSVVIAAAAYGIFTVLARRLRESERRS